MNQQKSRIKHFAETFQRIKNITRYLLQACSKTGHSEDGTYKCGEPVSNWTVNVFFGVPVSISPTYNVSLKIKIYIFQLGSRVLEEYEILKEVLYIDTIENKSCAHVKFAFRRRIEYHITNTFTQVKGKPYVQR